MKEPGRACCSCSHGQYTTWSTFAGVRSTLIHRLHYKCCMPYAQTQSPDNAVAGALPFPAPLSPPPLPQVRWASFCQRWVTTADDGVLRLWSREGQQDSAITLKGGSCK